MFMPGLASLVQTGTLALLYCASYYALHGGNSRNGDWCGSFYVGIVESSSTFWGTGAALSFRL